MVKNKTIIKLVSIFSSRVAETVIAYVKIPVPSFLFRIRLTFYFLYLNTSLFNWPMFHFCKTKSFFRTTDILKTLSDIFLLALSNVQYNPTVNNPISIWTSPSRANVNYSIAYNTMKKKQERCWFIKAVCNN